MTQVTAKHILNYARKTKKISVPELVEGGEVLMQEMSVKDWAIHNKYLLNDDNTEKKIGFEEGGVVMIVLSLKDKKERPLFTVDNIPELLDKLPFTLFQKLSQAAQDVNAITQDAVEVEKKD